jgi:hypothetical protein
MQYYKEIEGALEVESIVEGSSLVVSLSFPSSFSYFDGHFHDEAILPAFMIVQVSVDLIERLLKHSLNFLKISKSKF